MIKRIGIWTTSGIVIGFALTLWLGPKMVTWWFTPPGNTGAFTCQPQIQEATSYLVRGQLVVALTLGLLGAIGAALRGKKVAPVAKTEAPKKPEPPSTEVK